MRLTSQASLASIAAAAVLSALLAGCAGSPSFPDTGPLFSGPQQQPFVCRSQESGLGQPQADNQEGIGHPVFDADGRPIGHSRYCIITPRVAYFYYNGATFKPYSAGHPPADLARTTVGGASLPFIVRLEVRSINRFLTTAATLAPAAGTEQQFDAAAWNGKLVYWLRGGVGIGHHQGTAMWFNEALGSAERQLLPRILSQGYAVLTSSGNETGVHYNMQLAEETALMSKAWFTRIYGKPKFTIGIGGSGGAVQQYLFAQNRPGLLDAGIPIQSYPDMITQTIPISDCPLLGQYFSDAVALDPASPWASWSRQRLVEGMNASDTVNNPLTGKPGSTECISGWRLALPNVLNPVYKDARFDTAAALYRYRPDVYAKVKWTHWNDLANIYGTDSGGFAPISIDNVGVQYGLGALVKGAIGTEEFLRINACAGSWKEQADFVDWDAKGDPFEARNMRRSASCREPDGMPAPRRAGDIAAIRTAHAAGQVFTGRRLGIPMIDLRPYLDGELNMHNARQSFAARARMMAQGPKEAQKQVIWFAGSVASGTANVIEALAVLERYLDSGTAPAGFTDRCVDAAGTVIGAGPAVWDGILDNKPAGACTRAFPVYSSPRMVAGESIRGDTFKCALKPVAAALADGSYGAVAPFSAAQQVWLAKIFPHGVCDYQHAAGD